MWQLFQKYNFQLIIQISSLGIRCEIALKWMSQNLDDGK